MPNILITGGAGFIYSHVARYFVERGWNVTIADHFDMQGKGKNIVDILPKVRLLIGDLCTGALVERCAEICPDYVVHAASYTHVDDSIMYPERFVMNNVVGTTRLLQALWEKQGDSGTTPVKIIIVSSDEVYGPTPYWCFFDEHTPYNPSNAYAASKVGVEAIAQAFFTTHHLPIVIVRPCNTYASKQFPTKIIPKFIGQMLRKEPVTLYNDGGGSRDWLHADDHALAVYTLLMKGQLGHSYNLGANEEHTDADILERIQTILFQHRYIESPAMVIKVPGRPGHDRRYAMDSSKLGVLGWSPEISFDCGLEETVLWNASHQDWWENDLCGVK